MWFYLSPTRDLLQLHHVYGGEQCCHHHHDPQLPSQAGRHPRDAGVGRFSVPNFKKTSAFLNFNFRGRLFYVGIKSLKGTQQRVLNDL
jgi:hypothetical protein